MKFTFPTAIKGFIENLNFGNHKDGSSIVGCMMLNRGFYALVYVRLCLGYHEPNTYMLLRR